MLQGGITAQISVALFRVSYCGKRTVAFDRWQWGMSCANLPEGSSAAEWWKWWAIWFYRHIWAMGHEEEQRQLSTIPAYFWAKWTRFRCFYIWTPVTHSTLSTSMQCFRPFGLISSTTFGLWDSYIAVTLNCLLATLFWSRQLESSKETCCHRYCLAWSSVIWLVPWRHRSTRGINVTVKGPVEEAAPQHPMPGARRPGPRSSMRSIWTAINNHKLAMHVTTGFKSGNDFVTDLNGFKLIRQKTLAKLPKQSTA